MKEKWHSFNFFFTFQCGENYSKVYEFVFIIKQQKEVTHNNYTKIILNYEGKILKFLSKIYYCYSNDQLTFVEMLGL